nr:hypothetical protein [uncultured Allomuricauda sp.]
MENFLTIDLGDVLLIIALVLAFIHLKKELATTNKNVLDNNEEINKKLNALDDVALKSNMNKEGDLEIRTKEGIWLTSFQIDSKEAKK